MPPCLVKFPQIFSSPSKHPLAFLVNLIVHFTLLHFSFFFFYLFQWAAHHYWLWIIYLTIFNNLQDEHLINYFIKNGTLKPIIDAFVANGSRYNLLNSAVLELLEFIRKVHKVPSSLAFSFLSGAYEFFFYACGRKIWSYWLDILLIPSGISCPNSKICLPFKL